MNNNQKTFQSVLDDKELMEVIHKGYEGEITHCFHIASMYTQGFLDGMRYQEDGTVPKTLDDIYQSIKNCNEKKCQDDNNKKQK